MTLINKEQGNLRKIVQTFRDNGYYGRPIEEDRGLRRHYVERYNLFYKISPRINFSLFLGGSIGFLAGIYLGDIIDGNRDGQTTNSLGFITSSLVVMVSVPVMAFGCGGGVRRILSSKISRLLGHPLDYQI